MIKRFNRIWKLIFHPPTYPSEVPSKGGKVAYFFLWHDRLFNMGMGKVLGKFTQLFKDFSWGLLIIDKLDYVNLSVKTMIVLCITFPLLIWFLGWLYVVGRIDVVEQILLRDRDVLFREMHEILKNGKKRD